MKKKIVLVANFDFDKYNIRPDAVPILEQACKTLDEPGIDVYLDGHTDSVGTVEYNQRCPSAARRGPELAGQVRRSRDRA